MNLNVFSGERLSKASPDKQRKTWISQSCRIRVQGSEKNIRARAPSSQQKEREAAAREILAIQVTADYKPLVGAARMMAEGSCNFKEATFLRMRGD